MSATSARSSGGQSPVPAPELPPSYRIARAVIGFCLVAALAGGTAMAIDGHLAARGYDAVRVATIWVRHGWWSIWR